jgi:acyl-CoA synthetase (AMP-forming)/AMP-acid ligase II/acyl carrier protein
VAFERLGLGPNDRCAIALPEGPELAVCLLAVSARCVAVPMNPWNPEGEIAADLAETNAKALIVRVGEDFDHIRRAARTCGAVIIDLASLSEETGLFHLFQLNGDAISGHGAASTYNSPDDIALTLFTSGTSGRKKLVPIRLQDLCVGASALAVALELGPNDLGYNVMPLFHVGGIIRNLYAPLLAGSGMIYSSGFDATMFWDVLDSGRGFTWYYASPTMHDHILHEGALRPLSRHKLRFICNAAGDLLPSTAEKLRDMFDAVILPGYGMTECMPIACPPLDYRLGRRGTSGRILGPDVSIRDETFNGVPVGASGRIFISGAPVARRQLEETDPHDQNAAGDWFDTGDIGRFDEDGFLYIVGRGKDVIKRGGETVAPAEIEEVLVAHPDVRSALAFSVPHQTLGETVGAVIVPRSGRRVGLEGLAAHLSKNLTPAKWPVALVYMEDLPKSSAGKLLRVGLAARLGIGEVDEKSPARSRLLTADCPPAGADISTPLPSRVVEASPAAIEAAIRQVCPVASEVLVHVDDVSGTIRAAIEAIGLDDQALSDRLHAAAHDYLVPRSLVVLEQFPRDAPSGTVDVRQVLSLLDTSSQGLNAPSDKIEAFILDEWRKCLGQDRDVYLDSDFFDDLGGDSLRAVRIIADVRKQYGIALPPTSIFRHRTILSLAAAVRAAIAVKTTSDADEPVGDETHPHQEGPAPKAQTAFSTLMVQVLPVTLLPPLFKLGQFVCWMFSWWYMRSVLGFSGAWVMFAALAAAYAVRSTLTPLAAICLKWIIIGRYRPGSAPLWGQAYLRWWLVRQIYKSADLGVFAASYSLTALYYRLMGARVGAGTRIAPNADLGEFDLLTIGENVCIEESAIVRPFVLEGGAMAFRPINIGANVSIGIRATIVPGAVLPADTDIAPLASSDDPNARNLGTRALCRPLLFSPPAWLKGLGLLIKGALMLASWAPLVLLTHNFLASMAPSNGAMTTGMELLLRMMSPERLATEVV